MINIYKYIIFLVPPAFSLSLLNQTVSPLLQLLPPSLPYCTSPRNLVVTILTTTLFSLHFSQIHLPKNWGGFATALTTNFPPLLPSPFQSISPFSGNSFAHFWFEILSRGWAKVKINAKSWGLGQWFGLGLGLWLSYDSLIRI